MGRTKAAGRVGISVGYWQSFFATHLFRVQGVFFLFWLVISIPSHLSPPFLSLPSTTDNNVESWLLPFILLESLSFFGYPVKCVTIIFQKNTRYSTSVILYFLSILPFWVISFAFSVFIFPWVVFGLGWGGHWVETATMEKRSTVPGRLERRVYWIKWNKTDIYLLAHSRHL